MAEAAAQYQKGLEQLALLPSTPEHQRQELEFFSALGAVVNVAKGQAAPETGHAIACARELWEQMGSPLEFLQIPFACGNREARRFARVCTEGGAQDKNQLRSLSISSVINPGPRPGRSDPSREFDLQRSDEFFGDFLKTIRIRVQLIRRPRACPACRLLRSCSLRQRRV
jgi:hypothetical protein